MTSGLSCSHHATEASPLSTPKHFIAGPTGMEIRYLSISLSDYRNNVHQRNGNFPGSHLQTDMQPAREALVSSKRHNSNNLGEHFIA